MGFGEQVNASGFDPDMVGALPTTPANYNKRQCKPMGVLAYPVGEKRLKKQVGKI